MSTEDILAVIWSASVCAVHGEVNKPGKFQTLTRRAVVDSPKNTCALFVMCPQLPILVIQRWGVQLPHYVWLLTLWIGPSDGNDIVYRSCPPFCLLTSTQNRIARAGSRRSEPLHFSREAGSGATWQN